jgi:ribosomal protein S3
MVTEQAVREVVDRHAPPGTGVESVVVGRSGGRLLVTIHADNPTLLIGPQGRRLRAVQRDVRDLEQGTAVRVSARQAVA